MAKDPAFPWYASDWLGSNLRAMLTLEQQGAYVNLLCRQWTDDTCSLPDDDEALACLSGLGEGWLKGGCQLLRKGFPKHPTSEGRIANPRLLEVRQERDDFLAKSSKGGKKSGEVRAVKARQKRTSGKTKGGSSTLGSKRQANGKSPSPSSLPSSSPSSSSSSSPSSSPKVPPKSPKGDLNVDAVWAHYKTHRPRARVLSDDVRKKLLARLKEGFAVKDLCLAIDGNYQSPHHCGQNDQRTEYHELELIVRSAEKVSMFIGLAEKSDKPVLNVKSQAAVDAAASYCDRMSKEEQSDVH